MTIPPNTHPATEPSSLFSLSSLESLAVATDLLVKTGPAEQEGSGVLDIHALAQATQRRRAPADSIAPTVPALLTPNLPRAEPEGWSRGTKLVVAGMGLSIVALGGAVAFLALRSPVLPSAAPLTAGVVAVQAPAAQQPAAVAVDGHAEPAPAPVPALAAAPEAPVEPESRAKPAERTRARVPEGTSKTASAAASAPAPVASSNASIDSLLDKALGAPSAKPRPAAAAAPAAATPSRDEVLGEMKKVGARAKNCGGEAGSMAIAKITVAGSTGRVTHVDLEGPSDARVRACITHEVSRAKLAPFSAPTFSVTYPFRL